MHTSLNTSLALDLAQQRRNDLESAARLHRLVRHSRREARRRSRDPGTHAAVIQMPAAPAAVAPAAQVPAVCRVA